MSNAVFRLAQDYAMRMRNPRKREYAAGWLGFRAGIIAHKPTEKGLSYMAAQAVRNHIDSILNPDEPEGELTVRAGRTEAA